MILRLALRSLLTHPIRTLVLACGFGLGVGVMAMLLGVGEVILDQARSPAVSGGGDVVIASSTGNVPSARWILSSGLETGAFKGRVSAASPSRRTTLYLVRDPKAQTAAIRRGTRALSYPFASQGASPRSSARSAIPRPLSSAHGPMRLRMRRGPLPIQGPHWRRSIDFIPFPMCLRARSRGPNGSISTGTRGKTAFT